MISARSMLITIAVMATTACVSKSAAPLAPSSGIWRFTGTVGTTTLTPIVGAHLTVLDGANKGVQVTTDSKGRYLFPSLAGGTFSVTIVAPGFVSVNPLVNLYGDLDVDFALRTP